MLPEEFLKRMERELGEEYPAFLESLERPRAVALRLNPLKGPAPRLPFAREPVPWEPEGYYYDPQARPGLHPYHEAGIYYLQEASAMSAVALLDPRPGETVCDLCAAPGGKSTQIAARMEGRGLLVCNEVQPKRAKILSRNVERMGVANALVTNAHPAALASRLSGFFDRVLVDAPCSGEGMFRKEAAAVEDWSPETVAMCAGRQREILRSAGSLVKPGGRLVYSTCTFSREENVENIRWFLSQFPQFRPEEVSAPWFASTGQGMYRLWPHKLRGEGHFAAVLRRTEGERERIPIPVGERPGRLFEAFARELGITLPEGKGLSFGESLFWLPERTPDLSGLRVLRPGLELGQERKGRFEPAHALALWGKNLTSQADFPAEGPEIAGFLHGEPLPWPEKGWCLVTVDGYSLGWGKGDGQQLKNHYPKGLRK